VAAAAASSSALAAETAVQGVLERYRQAFNTLNADGIEAFWPSVPRRTIDRAFAQLEAQTFRFDSCSIDVNGATATASCAGRAQYTPKVGNRIPQNESRRWSFRLRQANGRWFIESVNSR
jgi:hypothetical protein